MKFLAALLALAIPAFAQHRLDVEVLARFGDAPLAFDTLALETAAKQNVSVTRCDLLLSGAALQRESGEWIGAEKWAAFVSARGGRTAFALVNVPAGKFARLRFHVGVPAEINKGDPAQYPAGHPLNPTVNGMHWGWQGGYVFAAIEGRWRGADGAMGGYSYHLANHENLMSVELPLALDFTSDHTLRILLNARRVFDGLAIMDENATTHSRPGDPLAARLRDNLAGAFRIESLAPTPTRAEVAAKTNALIARDATPYRLTFSASFPRPALPLDNPLTNEGVALGARLFREKKLSGNSTQACASCHEQKTAFSDARRFSTGSLGDTGTRQAMPLFNLAWKSAFFWDGRAPSLRVQALEPIQNPIEMHATLPQVVERIAGEPGYPPMFAHAFGTPEVNPDRIARALEQFLLTLVSFDSKFDRAMRGGAPLSDEEQRGFALFNTEFDPARGQRGADCFHCHGGALFQSTAFASNGLDAEPRDAGRFDATKLDGDRGRFAVPSLRNVALTAPYMHDGRFATLEEVIEHYDHGLARGPTLDPNLAKHPRDGLQLSAEDKRALAAFLKTLTDEQFATQSK